MVWNSMWANYLFKEQVSHIKSMWNLLTWYKMHHLGKPINHNKYKIKSLVIKFKIHASQGLVGSGKGICKSVFCLEPFPYWHAWAWNGLITFQTPSFNLGQKNRSYLKTIVLFHWKPLPWSPTSLYHVKKC